LFFFFFFFWETEEVFRQKLISQFPPRSSQFSSSMLLVIVTNFVILHSPVRTVQQLCSFANLLGLITLFRLFSGSLKPVAAYQRFFVIFLYSFVLESSF
jgi:hypothetical protein